MNETKNNSIVGKRPTLITIFCIQGFLASGLTLLPLLNPSERTLLIQLYGPIIIPISVLIVIFGLAGFIGYWKMRKWGLYLYSVMAIISFGNAILLNMQADILSYILPIVTIGLGIIYYNRMT